MYKKCDNVKEVVLSDRERSAEPAAPLGLTELCGYSSLL